MEDPKDKKGHEDELSATGNDKAKKIESFKTGDKKKKRYFDQPFDEQMHDPDSLSENGD